MKRWVTIRMQSERRVELRDPAPEPPPPAPVYWTISECAEALNVSVGTLKLLRLRGLPTIIIPDTEIIRFQSTAVMRWFEKHERRAA